MIFLSFFPSHRVDEILIFFRFVYFEFLVAVTTTFYIKIKHVLNQGLRIITAIAINKKTTSSVSFTALLRGNLFILSAIAWGNMITIDGPLLIKMSSGNMLS